MKLGQQLGLCAIALSILVGLRLAYYRPSVQLKRHFNTNAKDVKVVGFVKASGKDAQYYWHIYNSPQNFHDIVSGFHRNIDDVAHMQSIIRNEFGEADSGRFTTLYSKMDGRIMKFIGSSLFSVAGNGVK